MSRRKPLSLTADADADAHGLDLGLCWLRLDGWGGGGVGRLGSHTDDTEYRHRTEENG